MHHSNGGMTQRLELVKEFDHARVCRLCSILLLAHLAQVAPGAKHLSSPAYDDHTDVAVLL